MPVHPVDIITLLLGVFFFVRGFQKGLIVEITTIVALVMGIIAAMQLAGIVSQYMAEVIGKAKWVFYAGYLLSFLLVFFAVQLLGKGVEQALQATQLNFINILTDLIANAEDFFKELNQNLQERTSEAR